MSRSIGDAGDPGRSSIEGIEESLGISELKGDDRAKLIAKYILEDCSSYDETDQVILTSAAEGSLALNATFELAESLPSERKEEIFQGCLEDYRCSIRKYEDAVAKQAFSHPKTIAIARKVCDRLDAILKAYNEVKAGRGPPSVTIRNLDAGADLVACFSGETEEIELDMTEGFWPREIDDDTRYMPGHQHSLFSEEFKLRMLESQFFGSSGGVGSIGFNPLAIRKAIEEGNLREYMTMIYTSAFTFFVNEVLADPDMIDKINERLTGFKIDKELLEREEEEGRGILDTSRGKMIHQTERVRRYREEEKGRMSSPEVREMDNRSCFESRRSVRDFDGMTGRELIGATGELITSDSDSLGALKVSWWSGSDCMRVRPGCAFDAHAKALGGLPVLTGPSGTADGLMHTCQYLGIGKREDLEDFMFALVGWMVPGGDHTLHEIRAVAHDYGFKYDGLPGDTGTFYQKDPSVVAAVMDALKSEGIPFPGECFDEENQFKVAQRLGFI